MLRRNWNRLVFVLVVSLAAGLGLGVNDASACPNCKGAVASQPKDAQRTASGYNYSILLMIAVPFTLFGTGSFMVYRAAKRGALPEF